MAEYLEITYEKFIFKVKTGYFYSDDDFWADIQGNVAVIGLSDFLQKSKGDVAFLEMADPEANVTKGQPAGKIETIKSTFDIIVPVSGKIIEVNSELETRPDLINSDPYHTGWLYKIKIDDPMGAIVTLLPAESYLNVMKAKVAKEAKKLYG